MKEENKLKKFQTNYVEDDSVLDSRYLVSSRQASWLVHTFFCFNGILVDWMTYMYSHDYITKYSLFQPACFPWNYSILQ